MKNDFNPEVQGTGGVPANPGAERRTSAMLDRLSQRVEQRVDTRRILNSGPPRPTIANPQQFHSEYEGIEQYWLGIKKRKWSVALAGLLGSIAGLIFTLPQMPVYHASTTIEVLDLNANPIQLKEGGTATPETNLMTQVSILESRSLQDRVVKKLQANPVKLPPAVDRYRAWRKLLSPAKGELSWDDMVNQASGGVGVSASSTNRIIEIGSDAPNPQLAALYANTLAAEFIEERLQSHWEATQHASEWLTRQLSELKVKLERSEDELQQYARSANLQYTGETDTTSAAQEKLKQLQSEVSGAQADRVAKQARYELVLKSSPDSLGEILDDNSLSTSRQKVTDLRRELADLTSTLTPENQKVRRVQAQITALEADMVKSRNRIIDRIKNDLLAAQNRESLLNQELSAQSTLVGEQSGKTIHYNILKREVDSNRQLYDSLLQRVKESGVSSAMRSSNFRVIDKAMPSGAPIRPSLRRGMMFGLFFGLVVGVTFVLIREGLDRSVTTPGETPALLGAPELGVIPAGDAHTYLAPSKAATRALLGSGINGMTERISFSDQTSMTAEAFRVALTSVLLANHNGDTPRVIAISSSGPYEGKTTVACNLAIAFAEINWNTLLIDGDMRRPRLHKIFGVENEKGIASLLQAEYPSSDLQSLAVATEIPNLHVLPRGKLKATPVNLLYSPQFSEILREAKSKFDVVLIDTPPMLHLPDARAIGHAADGVVFVVRSAKTTRDVIMSARQLFAQDDIRVLGSILNAWNPKVTGYHGYEGYKDYGLYYQPIRSDSDQ